ncbi:rop guanine nucleotide exchange factor 11-like [Dendrobium catenatum]|nr:rop guanine nucleotide exchange factor 11-like [Dendrobium catenatum]
MSMIEDVLLADQLAQDPSKNSNRKLSLSDSDWAPLKKLDPIEEMKKLDLMESPTATTLSDFMGWSLDQDLENDKQKPAGSPEDILGLDELKLKKPPNVVTQKKFSYIEKLENFGGWGSPAARR